MPAVFLFLHMWRFLWVLRQSLKLNVRTALRSMYNFFSMGWVVTLACIQGLIQKKGVFLRTPKTRDDSRVLGALRVTQWEGLIGLTFLAFGLLAFLVRPELKTLWLGLLLGWQASLYLAAPYFSLLSIQSAPAPTLRQPILDRGRPVTEKPAAKWAWASALILAALVWIGFQIPIPTERPGYSQFQPPDIPPQILFGIEVAPSATPTALIPPLASTPPTSTAPLVTSTNTATGIPTQTTASPTPSSTSAVVSTPTQTLLPATPTVVSPLPTVTPSVTSTFTPTFTPIIAP